MSDQSNLCTRCEIGNTKRDSYFCADCEKYATVSRLVNRAADDDGERLVPMTQDEMSAAAERISARMETRW